MLKAIKTKEQLLSEIETLEHKVAKSENSEKNLQKLNQKLESSKQQFKQQGLELNEKIKELNCLYNISNIIRKDNTLEDMLQDATSILHSYSLYPKVTRVKIRHGKNEYVSQPFRETNWKQHTDIVFEGSKLGSIEIFYLKNKIELFIGSSLREENKIITEIAEMIGQVIKLRQAKSKLKANEIINKSIVDTAPNSIITITIDGVIKSWNNAAEKTFGYKAAEILNENISKIIPDKFKNKYYRDINRLIKVSVRKAVGKTIELTGVKKNGTEFPIEFSLSNLATIDQKHFTGIIRDITEVKKKKLELNRFKLIVSSTTDMLALLDKQYKYIFANEGYSNAFQLTPEQLEGKSVSEIFGEEFFTTSIKDRFDKCLSGETINFQEWFKFPSYKHRQYMDISYNTYYNEDNKISGLVLSAKNITEKKLTDDKIKKSEELLHKLNLAVNTSKEVIFMTDKEGVITFINQEFTNLYGYSIEEIVGKTTPRILKGDFSFEESDGKITLKIPENYNFNTNYKQLWLKLLNKESISSLQFVNKKKDGTFICIEASIDPIVDSKDEIIGFLCIQRDITERLNSLASLNNALIKSKESDRLKSEFLATMSHELRTPLNAIIGLSGLIDKNSPIDDIVEYNKIINTSGEHLLNVLEDLFDISVIEAGQISIERKNIELHTFLNDIHEIIKIEQKTLDKNNISLNLIVHPENTNLIIATDPLKLKRILVNILKNALKFTEKGFINYGYNIETIDGKLMLKFYIEDTGAGIQKEDQEIIFNMFRQVDGSFNRKYEGAGVGLATSKKLVNLFKGSIWIESELGKGSTFYFTIPLEKLKFSNKPIKTKTALKEKEKNITKTVLIVEDDVTSFNYLKTVLKQNRINTLWAKNGKTAIKYCIEHPEIDLVFMDINMPVMDGYEATIEIKKIKPSLPIIAQTAHAFSGDYKKSQEAGCDNYITKPIKKEFIMGMINHYL